jgi:hypothetical protein
MTNARNAKAKPPAKAKVEFALLAAGLVIAAVALLATGLVVASWFSAQQPRACTMEAKLCPDGSAVGRIGPNCEFAPCPTDNSNCTCPQGYVKDGLTCNPNCYYSTPKCLTASVECTPAK